MKDNNSHITLFSLNTNSIVAKIGDYAQLIKLKLNLLVVFTSIFAYAMTGVQISFVKLIVLFVGGLLISGASGAINEILEINPDFQMKRTKLRPLPDSRMSKKEAWSVALISLLIGLFVLYYTFNVLTVILSLAVVVLYAFVYTPLKRMHPISVLVGAIPGALPPVIGWVAATNAIGQEAVFLFMLQFLWQFPHFWAVAFMANDDYQKAGFKILPVNAIDDRKIAKYCNLYSIALIPISFIPFVFGFGGMISYVALGISALIFSLYSIRFYKYFDYESARKLMFASIIYLPIVYIAMYLDYLLK